MSKIVFYINWLLLLIFSSCNSELFLKETPAINELKPGQKFIINLKDDNVKGWNWFLEQEFDNKIVGYDSRVWHGNEKGVFFHFQAKKLGSSSLKFVLRKYTDTLANKTFVIKVTE